MTVADRPKAEVQVLEIAARKPTFRPTQPLGGERAADIAVASGDESLSGALYLQAPGATPVTGRTLLEVAADAAAVAGSYATRRIVDKFRAEV